MDSVAAVGSFRVRSTIFVAALLTMLPAIAPASVLGTRLPDLAPPTPTVPMLPMQDVQAGFAEEPDYVAATRADFIGRVIVPVTVNGKGPYMFALDTGANRSVISPRLISALGLQVAESQVTMHGATGSAAVPTVMIDRIEAGDLVIEHQRLPVADAMANGIDGILGVDGLAAKCVDVDFTNRRINIGNTSHRAPRRQAMEIPAQLKFGSLLVVDAYVEGMRVKAVIDTGSEYTLGNRALYRALSRHANADVPNPTLDVLGTTLAFQQGLRLPIGTLNIGEVRVSRFNVVFGQFYIFKLWNLDNQPAIVLGMDLIGHLDALVIDYPRHEVQMQVRPKPEQLSQR